MQSSWHSSKLILCAAHGTDATPTTTRDEPGRVSHVIVFWQFQIKLRRQKKERERREKREKREEWKREREGRKEGKEGKNPNKNSGNSEKSGPVRKKQNRNFIIAHAPGNTHTNMKRMEHTLSNTVKTRWEGLYCEYCEKNNILLCCCQKDLVQWLGKF